MKISLNNFRAFDRTPDIEIRPLTLLVGENSTGKTSLLAALRFAFELSRSEDASFFNSPPFDFGPFEDVVFSHGPQEAQKRFSIAVEKYVRPAEHQRFPLRSVPQAEPILVRCTFFFKSSFGDTVLSSVRLNTEESQLDFQIEGPRLTIVSEDGRREFGQEDLFSPLPGRESFSLENTLYLMMQFRFSREKDVIKIRDDEIVNFISLFDAFINDNHVVVSTPPVRSVPRKVYTSSDESSHTGMDAPHELSKIKRSNRKRWSKINKDLNKFGKTSGLFSRFDIKKLTQQDSGPFQVKVTVRNRASSISDVGYGVSQSLPIMTDLIVNRASQSALLMQQPEVHLHPKAQAELGSMFAEFVDRNSNGVIVAETHSDHLIDRVRIEVREKRLNPSMVNIVFLSAENDQIRVHQIGLDVEGNIIGAPTAYRDFFIREQERILGF